MKRTMSIVVYVDGPKEAEEENKSAYTHLLEKRRRVVRLLSIFPEFRWWWRLCYQRSLHLQNSPDGWNMAETIVPNALPGAKRVWPEKLWPAEYKGLNDPELRAILEEY